MKEKQENNFGIIRLIGAVMVIMGHMYTLVAQPVPVLMWNTVNSLGVAIFFCIGGYLITQSWLRDSNFKRYMIKRVFRIFPALVVCIVITTVVFGPLLTNLTLRDYFGSPVTRAYLKNILLNINYALPGVFADNTVPGVVNGSIWCLPVEFLMYLIIPVYLNIGNKLSAKAGARYYWIITALIAVLGGVYTTWFYDTHFVFYGMDFSQIIVIIPYYFIGSLFAVCRLEKLLNLQTAAVALIVASGLSFLPAPFCYWGAYLLIPYVILSLAMPKKAVFAGFNRLDISYGMFLFSFVIQQILIQICVHRGIGTNVYVLLLPAVLLSAAFGFAVERFVEKPMGKLCKKLL